MRYTLTHTYTLLHTHRAPTYTRALVSFLKKLNYNLKINKINNNKIWKKKRAEFQHCEKQKKNKMLMMKKNN